MELVSNICNVDKRPYAPRQIRKVCMRNNNKNTTTTTTNNNNNNKNNKQTKKTQ